jgi:hypothetical protein
VRAFGQIQICSGHPQARLLTLASWPEGHESLVWPHLLDALTAQAGRYGAHTVLAQVKDNSLGFEVLRRSEFVVYTRQEIWRLTAPLAQPDEMQLRPEEPGDQWYIQHLIASTVPRLIQQIEPVNQTGLGLVWIRDGGPLAYVCAHRGQHGCWLQLYLHPEVDRAARAIIQQAAAHYTPGPKAPLYFCIRRYQEWLNRPLVDLGFESLGGQAVMVRHTTARIAEPEHARVPVRETGLEATSPIVHGSVKRERKLLTNDEI